MRFNERTYILIIINNLYKTSLSHKKTALFCYFRTRKTCNVEYIVLYGANTKDLRKKSDLG